MRRPAIFLGLVVLVGAGVYKVVAMAMRDDEAEPVAVTPPPPDKAGLGLEWVKTQPPGWPLVIEVPRDWSEGAKTLLEGREWHFGGPRDDGWRIELSFGWEPSTATLETWAQRKIDAFEENPLLDVERRGRTALAGMPALYFIHTYDARDKRMRRIDYYFVGRGGRGFVRGIASARSWPKYAPIFEEAARRVAYRRK